MNISFDAKRIFHNNRGLGNYSRDMIRLLSNYYPENKYFLFNPRKTNPAFYSVPNSVKEINPHGIYSYFPSFWRLKGCVKEIKELETDIYHGLSQELPSGIHKTGIKTVVTMHDAIFMRYPELYDSLSRKIFISKNRYSCEVADKIIAISEQTKNDFIEFFHADAEKIEVVYQGCNNIFREKISQDDLNLIRIKYTLPQNFLLYVGAIEKRKNIETILQAIYTDKIDCPLIIVGRETRYKADLQKIIREFNLEKQVVFLHEVSTDDLPAIYTLASIFIYPSVFEGFGIPILEALCTGTPVITSKGSCFEETGGDAAVYVDYNDVQEMAFQIKNVLGNKQLADSMILKGHIHADKFTDDKVVSNLMEVYRSIL